MTHDARHAVLRAILWPALLVLMLGLIESPVVQAAPSMKVSASLKELSRKISGAILFAESGRIYKMDIATWKPVALGGGTFARWRTDGKKIAVYEKGRIYVMDPDGKNRKKLVDKSARSDHETSVIEFHSNQKEIIYLDSQKKFAAVDISTGKSRSLGLKDKYSGEPGISSNGKFMAARNGHDLYAIDLTSGKRRKYAGGCSSGVSPDGKWLMNNVGSHRELAITDWRSGKSHKLRLQVKGLKKPVPWDNHHWSNHQDYIASQTDKKGGGLYIIQVSNNLVTHLNVSGDVTCPDLYVGSGSSSPSTNRPVLASRPQKKTGSAKSFYVSCKLVEVTKVPPPAALKDYDRAMSANLYKVLAPAGGLKKGDTIIVCHWVYNQRKRIPIRYEAMHKTYRFQISSFDSHAKLEAERLIMELDDFDSPMFVCMDAWGKKIMRGF